MSFSPLGVTPYSALAHFRYEANGTEVLCAVVGPYESRASKKASFERVHIDVSISALSFPEDTSEVESQVKDCLQAVIAGEQYPYLTLMISMQVLRMGRDSLLPAALNAAYGALMNSGLALRHGLYAEEVAGISLAIVPATDLVLQSIGRTLCTAEEYAEAVRTVYLHSKNVPLPELS